MTLDELKRDLDLLVDCGRYPKLYGKKLQGEVRERILAEFMARQGMLFDDKPAEE